MMNRYRVLYAVLPVLSSCASIINSPFGELQNYLSIFTNSDTKYSPQCPIDIPYSCSNDTPIYDSCCFESPGGVVLQTQFWDYYPAVGPDDMFTLHGLWPDNCDGSYEQFCDSSLNIHGDIEQQVFLKYNETELLHKMKKYWKNFNGDDEELWVHEFNKHATCMTTIKPSCYGNFYKEFINALNFFNVTVNLFEQLPTYKWLTSNGIVPSESQTYTRQQIENTLSSQFGQPVYIGCNRYNALQEVWYFHHVKGSILSENFEPIPSLLNSHCPESNIKFLPKNFKPTPTGIPPPSKPTDGTSLQGFIKLTGNDGCLISNGKWYKSGTCATYHLVKAPFGGYNLRTSKGYCGIDDYNQLACNSKISPMQFQFDKASKLITFGGKFIWSAYEEPTKWKQVPISPGDEGGSHIFKLRFDFR
ncbi:hypothetical protein PACTADRAFT_50603 [Pachysolen tannophilus NRRL Y-2460]|uniref:Ribonuclease T2-like n=1 Tax=Pachysolen tannophilus NRRL Y-2460 TaxID=669874 RepID=A0A1E4TST9_PACTA|nr:hypothetical protein PACTADRAFT_50603 [Pachysolen tannophilus NRRL Y-2460]